MRHKFTVLLACACAFTALVGASSLRAETGTDPEPATTTTTTDETASPQLDLSRLSRLIQKERHETWNWQRVMGRPLTRELESPPGDPQQRLDAWRRLALRMHRRAENPPHKRAWLCIHHFEGSWRDPNAPYYGGLQMDVQFQRTYGGSIFRRKGTADHWTPLEQMWAAERAHRSGRGFYPWPNTARDCGLI
jgi:hypothetical protein